MKINVQNIILLVFGIFVVLIYFKTNKSNQLIDINLENQQKINELTEINQTLLQENADYRVQRAEIDKIEHEVKIFYDSLYVTEHTSVAIKDSVLADFLRQYDSIVGHRLH